MEEEYYEEEVLEESDDWLSEIRSSLQDEFLKRRAEKEAMAAKGKNGEVIEINESGHDSVVEYEEEIITGSFVRESMQSQVTVDEIVYESQEEEESADDDEGHDGGQGDEGYLKSIHSEFHKLFLERKAEKAKAAAAIASIPAIDRTSTIEEIVEEHDDEYEEQVIERWVFGGVAPEPEDLEEACRALIPIVYKGENVDPETMIRRTPLPELYRYLKQHYDYKKEVKQDLTDQETQAGEAQTTLESLFKKRAGGDPVLFGGKTSDLKDSSPQGEFAKKTTTVNENAGRSQRDSIVYEEVFLESTTDLDASGALLMGESERSFEEIVERSYSEEMVEIEETIHEEDDPQGSDLDEDEAYIV